MLRDIEVSEVGMGCMAFSHSYGKIPTEEYSIEAKKTEAIRVIANDEYLYWQRYYGPIDDSLCE